jgi:uncharacterized membrane protein YfcA
MDGPVLTLFLLSAFIGGMTTGLAGFAMGLVVSGVWLRILTPLQTATLIVGYGLLVQAYSTWRLRHALDWRNLAPFVAGGVVGVPLGTAALAYVDPAVLRVGVGLLLVAYSSYSLARPAFKPMHAGPTTETAVGVVNGFVGGLTGLAGATISIWCQLRGWPKDIQRAIYQPVIFVTFVITAISLTYAGAITAETAKLYAYGLPAVALGAWTGLKLYGHLDDAMFRRVILVLLLLSGLSLVVPALLG